MCDKFGFRVGTKRSIAANLYERGATQADLIAATGTTQYNMLKDAERRGHRVLVRGDRYWLIAAKDNVAPEISSKISAGFPQAEPPNTRGTSVPAVVAPSCRCPGGPERYRMARQRISRGYPCPKG